MEENSGGRPQLLWRLCWHAGGSCSREVQRLSVTVLVSAWQGSARRSQKRHRFQVGLVGGLDGIAGGSEEVCKELAALSRFTVLSLRLFYRFLIVCIPALKDRLDIKLPMQSLNFCSLFACQKRLRNFH